MRKGFTLIELMISVTILSIIMIFLYESYSQLNKGNKIFASKVQEIKSLELLKKVIYSDFSLSTDVKILDQNRREDVVFLNTANSIHQRFCPNVAYVVNDKKLYRLESLKPFVEYPLISDSEFVSDFLGEVKIFRVYKSKDEKTDVYLIHIEFEDKQTILLKVNALG